MYDISGAASNPVDTVFGNVVGRGTDTSGSGTFTIIPCPAGTSVCPAPMLAIPSEQNELVMLAGSIQNNSFTGLTSPSGARSQAGYWFDNTLGGEYEPSYCDENNPWALFYNGSSVSSETWTATFDRWQGPVGGWGVTLTAFRSAPADAPLPPTNLQAIVQ